jgi:hypothetical protein
MLERPALSLQPPTSHARPTSSHGGNRGLGLQLAALNKNKELPPLPRYIVPAPLFACNSPAPSPQFAANAKHQEELRQEEEHQEDTETSNHSESNSHFSTWSTESVRYSLPLSDDGTFQSPTFSSLTSTSSDTDSPNRLSARFSISDYMHSPDSDSVTIDEALENISEADIISHLSVNPPQLDELRISAFGSDLFNFGAQRDDTDSRGSRVSRRQVACMGLGFQSYMLPEAESTSKVTVTEPKLRSEPSFKHEDEHSPSQMSRLVHNFSFMGEAVE